MKHVSLLVTLYRVQKAIVNAELGRMCKCQLLLSENFVSIPGANKKL
jgi:hypothetical protein